MQYHTLQASKIVRCTAVVVGGTVAADNTDQLWSI